MIHEILADEQEKWISQIFLAFQNFSFVGDVHALLFLTIEYRM